MESSLIYAGIEAGGTKFVCLVGSDPDRVFAEARFETSDPQITLANSAAFIKTQAEKLPISALGIASFGPLDLDQNSPTYGYITTTPKPGWSNTNILGVIKDALELPAVIDTDVNAAALAEYIWGGAGQYDPLLYLTIGTGIGGGIIVDGKPLHGAVHPEMGHLRIPHDPETDPFPGICPYHSDCLEGLATGPALQKRWGVPAELLPDDHPAWELEAYYIALAVVNLILSFSPRRVVLGGGVMGRQRLFPLIRRQVQGLLAGYLQSALILEHIDELIVAPALGDRSGVLGAIALAMQHTHIQATIPGN